MDPQNPTSELSRVTVVIPTFNRQESLRRCLAALFACHTDGLQVDVRVVDDGSTDGTSALLEELQTRVRSPIHLHVHRQSRQGPSAARNLGIQAADTDLILFTDDDCTPAPGWIRALAQGATVGGGAVGRIVSASGSTRVSRYCQAVHYNEFPSFGRRPRQIGFANTANCAFSREALLAADGFDLLFSRVGYEDVDLSRRILLLGYRLTYVEEAKVRHHHREDVPALWRAFWKRGYASTLLDTAWETAAGASWQLVGAEMWALLRQLFLIVKIPFDSRGYRPAARWIDALSFACLDWLCETARACGALAMALRIITGRQSLERSCHFDAPEGGVRAALRKARREQRDLLAALTPQPEEPQCQH